MLKKILQKIIFRIFYHIDSFEYQLQYVVLKDSFLIRQLNILLVCNFGEAIDQ